MPPYVGFSIFAKERQWCRGHPDPRFTMSRGDVSCGAYGGTPDEGAQ